MEIKKAFWKVFSTDKGSEKGFMKGLITGSAFFLCFGYITMMLDEYSRTGSIVDVFLNGLIAFVLPALWYWFFISMWKKDYGDERKCMK